MGASVSKFAFEFASAQNIDEGEDKGAEEKTKPNLIFLLKKESEKWI
jgi:hypothetical protein